MTPMQIGKITIFQTDEGKTLGFHNENLEVALLSDSVERALDGGFPSEELAELKMWSESARLEPEAHSHELISSQPQIKSESKVRTITINATQLCNLKCFYCAAGGDGTYGAPMVKLDLKKALPQLHWFLEKGSPGDTFLINFLGGEPLLYPEIIREVGTRALEWATQIQVNLRFSVVTNGTRFEDERVLGLLVDFRMAVTVSIDGPPEVQDHFRPSKAGVSSSALVERGLRRLVEIKHQLPSVGLSAVFHRDHIGVRDTYLYFVKWDVDFYEFNYSHTDHDLNASREFSRGLAEVARIADLAGGESALRKIRSFDGIIGRLDQQKKAENFCGSGKSLLSMDSSGNLFACPWDINHKSKRLNNEVGVSEEALAVYQAPQVEKADCRSCWARYICGGGCHYSHQSASNGSSGNQRVDPAFCYRMKELTKTVISYYETYRRIENEAY